MNDWEPDNDWERRAVVLMLMCTGEGVNIDGFFVLFCGFVKTERNQASGYFLWTIIETHVTCTGWIKF